jgi:hypothetical protein
MAKPTDKTKMKNESHVVDERRDHMAMDPRGTRVAACAGCLHKAFYSPTCTAYPGGIPPEILDGRVRHRELYPGDNGIIWSPRNPEMWNEDGTTKVGLDEREYTMKTNALGRLEQVDLREVWTSEAGRFTPWLASEANLDLLGDTIGLDLELEAQEKDVGPFRADILCKDTTTGHWVLIENQLEKTDHTHLGQLLTYAAGLKAATIVWIARKFTDEHQAAIDWLNEITEEGITFFGLEVELWRIGESPMAPKFNIVCRPNDWGKTIVPPPPSELSATKQTQLEFWKAFRDYLSQQQSHVKTQKPQPQHWLSISIGRTGFYLSAVAAFWDSVAGNGDNHELRMELVIDGTGSKARFAKLATVKEQIEAELGEKLTWHNPADKRMCRIYLRRLVDLNDKAKWPEYHAWLLAQVEAFQRVFAKRVKTLDIGDDQTSETPSGTQDPQPSDAPGSNG